MVNQAVNLVVNRFYSRHLYHRMNHLYSLVLFQVDSHLINPLGVPLHSHLGNPVFSLILDQARNRQLNHQGNL